MIIWLLRTAALLAFLVAALGLFWFFQGAGLIVVDPVLCAGSCEPVQAPSLQWLITGGLTALVGCALGILAARRTRPR